MWIVNVCPFCLYGIKFSKMTFSLCVDHHLIRRNQLLIGIANFTSNANASIRNCINEECRPVCCHINIPIVAGHLIEHTDITNHFISDYVELWFVFYLENVADINFIICDARLNFAFIFNFIPIFRLYSKFDFISNISIVRLYIFQNVIFSIEL